MPRTKILIPLLLGAALFSHSLAAQNNFSGFNYQAVVRDANGDPMPNQNVGVQLVISCGILQPYVEDHSVTTDANGLMDLVIGEGSPVFGSAPFNTIDWSGCGTWTWNVAVSMDITGGTNYSLVGSQQMKAVPFALNAMSTANPPLTGWALVADDVFTTHPGNVGIGTNTPAHKLDVQGAINAEGGLYVGDQQTITYDGAGRTEFFDEAGNEHLEFNGYNTTLGAQPTYITDQFAIGLDPALELPAADLHLKGTFRLEDGLQASGKVLTSDADGNASWGPAAAATGWALIGDDLHNTNSGRVGIGTTTPDAKLTLGNPGQTWTDYGLTSDSRIGVVNGSGGRMAGILTSSATGGVLETFNYAAGVYAPTLINPNGGNVGVGTTAANSRLHVAAPYNHGTTLNLTQSTNSWGTPAWFNAHRYIQTNFAGNQAEFKQFNVGGGGVSIGYSNVPTYGSSDALYVNGRVGIGTNAPNHLLSLGAPSSGRHLAIWENGTAFYGLGNGTNQLQLFASNAANDDARMVIRSDGYVGIGTETPQSMLAVNGKITCKEVEVTLANFPDYVFDEDYHLLSLEEVAAYIAAYGHLPNVPSACEVEASGLGLGEMNRILLEKVEELTLHVISLNKELQELRH